MTYDIITTNWIVIQYIFIIVFAIISMGYFTNSDDKINSGLYFILITVTILICWIPNLFRFELNPDESEWLINANIFADNPIGWMRYHMMSSFGRILTIIPLAALSIFSFPMKWISARVLSIALWSLFVYLSNKSIQKVFSTKIANALSIIMVSCIGTTRQADILAYNSELPAIVCISAIIYFFIKQLSDPSSLMSIRQIMLLGAAIPSLVFIKDQTIIISFTLELAALYLLLTSESKGRIVYFLTANICVVCLFFLPYLMFGSLELLQDSIIFRNNYRYHGLYSMSNDMGFQAYAFIKKLYKSEIGKLFNLGLYSAGAYLLFTYFNRIEYDNKKIRVLSFIIIVLAVSIYTVYHPVDKFLHYYIYLIPPCLLLIAFGISLVYSLKYYILKYFFLAGALSFFFIGHKHVRDDEKRIHTYSYDRNISFKLKNKLSRRMVELRENGDRIMIWGWNNSYYVETGMLQGSRNTNISILNPKFGNHEFRKKVYLADLQHFKPRFILELVGPDQFYTKEKNIYSISRFTQINEYINRHYDLIEEVGNEKLYVRKK